jgi:hypothetical protein
LSVIKSADTERAQGNTGLIAAMDAKPTSQYVAACQRIEASVRTWARGYDQGDIGKLRRFIEDAELIVTVNKLHINGLTPADLPEEE